MKILEKYILKEIALPYAFALIGTFFLLLTGRMVQLTSYLLRSSVSIYDIIILMVLATPKLSLYAMPFVTMVAVALAFHRMNGDKELTAIRAVGVSIRRLWRPILVFAMINTLLVTFLSVVLLPHSNAAFRKKLNNMGRAGITAILQEGIFVDIIPGLVFYFQDVNPGEFTAYGVYIEDHRDPKHLITIIARSATIFYDRSTERIFFAMEDGFIMRDSENRGGEAPRSQIVRFESYRIAIDPGELGIGRGLRGGGKNEMTMQELRKAARESKDRHEARRYGLEFHLRIVLPLSCLSLAFLTVALCLYVPDKVLRLRESSIIWSVLITMATYLLYYFAVSFNKGLAENGIMSPGIALWTPWLITSALAMWLWRKVH
ncbi:lipopolysaccharide export system permease protein [Thermodesulforhabdus norvegica]|uniref:Lipopolysaccharide export system permease protein n=2 Tax=Thermodesulforhabdus norvegica TaxID=39841 RepID=A0A1I4V954_9BACT|nr:lipopolysaccharide export system permease protein [Thermodesulforhabdus norvegica]